MTAANREREQWLKKHGWKWQWLDTKELVRKEARA